MRYETIFGIYKISVLNFDTDSKKVLCQVTKSSKTTDVCSFGQIKRSNAFHNIGRIIYKNTSDSTVTLLFREKRLW